ncbi:MAG: AAA family ATPase [Marinilabiliaceae bacterium]|nr:AAA family ATPase [Marinilabiliaceae bacterium]
MVTISVMNQKGGVGKSTATRNLGSFFANQGYKTLMVDIDAQANLSQISNIPDDIESTVLDAFRNKTPKIFTVANNLSIIPSSLNFAGIELEIIGAMQREMFLVKTLNKLENNFDICLIDCPPAINMITTNSLAASQWVLIPMEASFLAFNGLEMMINVISMVREGLNPNLSILGAFINKYKEHTIVSRDILEKMKEKGIDIALFDAKIRQYEDFKKAEFHKKSIFEFAKGSLAASDYNKLGVEIVEKLKSNKSI